MAILTNVSDQFRFLIAIVGRGKPGWIKANMNLQHYVDKANQFQDWSEADLDIYETDLSSLKECLNSFGEVRDNSCNFEFEPDVEPSFQLSLKRIANQDDYDTVASITIDLKHISQIRVPSAYRENQIILRFCTDEQRVQSFIENLLAEIEGIS